MKTLKITLFVILYFTHRLDAQNQIVVSGSLMNKENMEPVCLAHVYIAEQMIGSISNTNGDYTLRLPMTDKSDTLIFSHVGFKTEKIVINFNHDTLINLSLTSCSIILPEYIVSNMTVKALFDSVLSHLKDNYSSKPVLLDVFMRVRVVNKSNPRSFNTGNALGEFALQIYKNSYIDLNRNNNQLKDQVKYIEWQKYDSLLKSEGDLYFILFSQLLPFMDNLNNISNNFIYNKKWVKANDIYIDGIETYQHGEAYRLVYKHKENAKGKAFEGKLLIDKNSFALVSYERYFRPEGVAYEALKTELLQMPFNRFEEADYIKHEYEKIGNTWYLKSIYLIYKETKQYVNGGFLGESYFEGVNESLEKASVESYSEAIFVVTKVDTNKVKKFKEEELLNLKDIKPFHITSNNVEFHKKYNTIDNSDLDLWIRATRAASKKYEKKIREELEKEE